MLRPLTDFTAPDRRNIAVVLTDIDDTLTDKGRLPAKAYAALERLKQAGFIVAPVTGRPAGWCDLIARQWPVDGVIGENGAFYFRYDDAKKRIVRHYAKSAAERQADAARLKEIEQTVLREVPGAAVAADQAYREADLAIDFCEDVAPLPKTEVLKIVGIFQRYGAMAKISSIHVNGWFGKYDKLSTSRLFLRDCFGIDIDHDKDSIVFVGDSPNDAPMFGFFPNSVGVANVLDFAGELPASPAFVTRGRGAEGFAEFGDALIAAKGME
ncbi:HAD-IIB family hydrolase [Mesorhizobium sp. LNJC403B00]|uniref:HAD-IIB family hydrolase n=1 Tax=Mesorhizobium sp. LNJC403B00 TaxID=1287280 RepID=UPI0004148D91|nr:HAD-IIB family hydrolase [Mesorhizobium sp. LNJC403B00]